MKRLLWTSTTRPHLGHKWRRKYPSMCASFSAPKKKHAIQYCSTKENTTCLHPSSTPDCEGKQQQQQQQTHAFCPWHSWKFCWAQRFLIYGFTTQQHQGHTQGTWNSPQLTLTGLSSHLHSLIFKSLMEKNTVWSSYFIFNRKFTASWSAVSSGFQCKAMFVCIACPTH